MFLEITTPSVIAIKTPITIIIIIIIEVLLASFVFASAISLPALILYSTKLSNLACNASLAFFQSPCKRVVAPLIFSAASNVSISGIKSK